MRQRSQEKSELENMLINEQFIDRLIEILSARSGGLSVQTMDTDESVFIESVARASKILITPWRSNQMKGEYIMYYLSDGWGLYLYHQLQMYPGTWSTNLCFCCPEVHDYLKVHREDMDEERQICCEGYSYVCDVNRHRFVKSSYRSKLSVIYETT
ncbi:hypothetical protein L2E82_19975 [Cichorium intybus]|uniref:Uncharacterized protein n=1 Tax=Cichorium intybus TaxID=13427 RepID=A0ACB9DSH0_CICIN|nr:hypothetical protein L2E82_19975 [Cichorium intybus]